ncbi:TraB/GumN family protein [Croceicoccus naphthovorans]|uniref:Uncharacterized protein n=1 Tax=Croceicoccus naphthovorans TaxID=1348774 RepID=A0A0G3XFX5_9SPHN|nr:TraB/GumN family protein [Croceicoccus naphthovorans]AKM10072.1 hypothetical protein AB433_08935 [Croceicoccus naphthovorans]MBB3991210.1 hypothetical protein [Croceicoccus naphthovorans]
MNFKSITRRLAPFAALLGLGSPAIAEEAAFDRADADPALWVLADDDTKIYLFGTMHALKPDLVWFDDAVSEAFAESDQLVLEILDPDESQIGPFLAKSAMAPQGEGLSTILTEDQYGRFEKATASLGIPAQALEQMRPWFAGVTLAAAPLAKMGYSPESGAEKILSAAAAEKGMTIAGLETFEQQMGFFSDLSKEDQVAFLMSGVDELPNMEQTFTDMEKAWATGDTAATAKLLNEGMEETPTLYNVLLANRNKAWAEWIGQRMETPGTVFIAVGAGHLAGDDSVQALLAGKGLNATRVEY